MQKNTDSKTSFGNDRFEGYAMDLMQEICSILNCSFTFELVPDGKYGNYDPVKKEWNGLIKYLLDRVNSCLINVEKLKLYSVSNLKTFAIRKVRKS